MQLSSLVDGRIQQREKTLKELAPLFLRAMLWVTNLVSNVRTGVADIAVHFPHNTNMLIAIQERILLLAMYARSTTAAV